MPIKRNLEDAINQAQKATNPFGGNGEKKSYQIENLFKPKMEDGKFNVVMRFLPCRPDEIKMFVENRTHLFECENKKWFGCECLGKYGKPCPICDFNRQQYKLYDKDVAKTKVLPRVRIRYLCNVYIVKNPNAPETENKIFRFDFGPKIMKMISEAMSDSIDQESGETIAGFNPFDWVNGANFIYDGVNTKQGPNLDKSKFGQSRRITKNVDGKLVEMTDAEIEAIEGKLDKAGNYIEGTSQLYSLDDCDTKEEDCKTYEEYVARYENKSGKVLQLQGRVSTSTPSLPSRYKTDEVTTSVETAPVEVSSEDDFLADLGIEI